MARKNFPMTVEALFNECKKEIAKGNGKKFVLISDDEEGNGYHECYFTFSPCDEYANTPYDLDIENCVTLG